MSLTSVLLAELHVQRRHVLAAINGVSLEQLHRPVSPTTWSPIAVVNHLALDVERWWFSAVVGNDPSAWEYFTDNPEGGWQVDPNVNVLELYKAESDKSDAIIRASNLNDYPPTWPSKMGPRQTVGQILAHVIGETATHAGHLDIVRESIDGHLHLVLE